MASKTIALMILALGLLAASAVAAARPPRRQDLVASAPSSIAGGASYKWTSKEVVVYMGRSHDCSQGDTLTFDAQGRVDIARCINGYLETTQANWTISPSGFTYPLLRFHGEEYQVIFSHSPYETMTLRKPGSSPTDSTHDTIYRR